MSRVCTKRFIFIVSQGLATQQQGTNQAYKVLQKDSLVHAVEIPNCPRVNETQYGYVFFQKSARPPGLVKRVNKVSSLIGCRASNHLAVFFFLV